MCGLCITNVLLSCQVLSVVGSSLCTCEPAYHLSYGVSENRTFFGSTTAGIGRQSGLSYVRVVLVWCYMLLCSAHVQVSLLWSYMQLKILKKTENATETIRTFSVFILSFLVEKRRDQTHPNINRAQATVYDNMLLTWFLLNWNEKETMQDLSKYFWRPLYSTILKGRYDKGRINPLLPESAQPLLAFSPLCSFIHTTQQREIQSQ